MQTLEARISTFYLQKDTSGRTTIVSYLMNKLSKLGQTMHCTNSNALSAIRDRKFDQATKYAQELQEVYSQIQDINRELPEHLTVDDILGFLDKPETFPYVIKRDIAHAYRYSKAVSVADYQKLVAFDSYEFKDVKLNGK